MSLSHENQQFLTHTLQDLFVQGLGEHVSLPMVVLCGDSDAAKHTVIQALTGLSLPPEYFNHRFSMEFIINRPEPPSGSAFIKVSIVPASNRTEYEKMRMGALNDDLVSTDGYWRALLEFLIGRSIVELNGFEKVTVQDTLRVQIEHEDLKPLVILVFPKLPPAEIYNENIKARLLAHAQNSRSVTLVAHDDVPTLRSSKINGLLHENLNGGGDRTMAVFVVRPTLSREHAGQVVAVTSNVCRGHTFKLGWQLLEETGGYFATSILHEYYPSRFDEWMPRVASGSLSTHFRDHIQSQFEHGAICAICSIADIRQEVERKLPRARKEYEIAARAVDQRSGPGRSWEERVRLRDAAEEKCVFLEKVVQSLKGADNLQTTPTVGAASSTVDPVYTPGDTEIDSEAESDSTRTDQHLPARSAILSIDAASMRSSSW